LSALSLPAVSSVVSVWGESSGGTKGYPTPVSTKGAGAEPSLFSLASEDGEEARGTPRKLFSSKGEKRNGSGGPMILHGNGFAKEKAI